MCSVTEIPSVMESEMQQNLQSLLSSACVTDSVHDVILQVRPVYCTMHNDCALNNIIGVLFQ